MRRKLYVPAKKQGELVMLSSNKNKLHESMMFHKGQQEAPWF